MPVVEKITKKENKFNIANFLNAKPLFYLKNENEKCIEIYSDKNEIIILYSKYTHYFRNNNTTILCMFNRRNHSCNIVYSKFDKLAHRKIKELYGCTDIEFIINIVYFYNRNKECIFSYTLD